MGISRVVLSGVKSSKWKRSIGSSPDVLIVEPVGGVVPGEGLCQLDWEVVPAAGTVLNSIPYCTSGACEGLGKCVLQHNFTGADDDPNDPWVDTDPDKIPPADTVFFRCVCK